MSKLDIYDKSGALLESHNLNGTFSQWLIDNVPSLSDERLFSARRNGLDWESYDDVLACDDAISLVIEPQDPITAIFAVIAVVSAAYTVYTLQNMPDQKYQQSAEPGKSIYSSNANANTILPNGIIREVAGEQIIYPDLICKPHRKYIDHEEWLYLMLSIGRGYFDLNKSNVYIAQSPARYYSNDVIIENFEPGDTVTGNEASENWYTSEEVANLRLVTASTPQTGIWTVDALAADFTFYLDGVAEPAPFIVGERFEMNTGSNLGYFQVTAISGADDEIATVENIEREGSNTSRIEALSQRVEIASAISGRSTLLVRNVFTNNGAPTLTPVTDEAVEFDSVAGGVNWEGPFLGCPINETAQYAEVDVNFPQGLTVLDDDGETDSASVAIAIQWREYGTSEWMTASGTIFTDSTYDERGYTINIDFGSRIRPEFRFRRITTDSEDTARADIVMIKRVKCHLIGASSYEGVTTMAIKLRGTNALATSAENKINIVGASRKLPTLQEIQDQINGTPYDLRASSTQVSVAWDASYSEYVSAATFEELTVGEDSAIGFNEDGTHMALLEDSTAHLYTLSVPYDAFSAEYDGRVVLGIGDPGRSIAFANSGQYIIGLKGPKSPFFGALVDMYEMSVPYDPDTALPIAAGSYTFGGAENESDSSGFYINDSCTMGWLGGRSNLEILQYSMTAFDLTTLSYDAVSLDLSADVTGSIRSIFMGDYTGGEPRRIYVINNSDVMYQYLMSTPGDITTATFQSSYSTALRPFERFNVFEDSVIAYNDAVLKFEIEEFQDTRATKSAVRFCAHALYEAMGDSASTAIDWDAMSDLDDLLGDREDYLNGEFSDETTLWEATKIMLLPGYAEPTIKEGAFFPVRLADVDGGGVEYGHLYTPDVMMGQALQVDHAHYDSSEPDGVDVEYFSGITNSMEVVECRLVGDAGIRPKRIQAIGINDETRAWRLGMRERNSEVLKPATYTFTTELDALNSEYGEICTMASDLFVSQYGELVSVDGSDVTLDFEPQFSTGSHYAAFRTREGLTSLYLVVAGPSSDTITLSSPSSLDFTPVTDGSMDSTMVTFGNSSEWGARGIIKNISPQGDNQVEVTATEYLSEIYANDNLFPS